MVGLLPMKRHHIVRKLWLGKIYICWNLEKIEFWSYKCNVLWSECQAVVCEASRPKTHCMYANLQNEIFGKIQNNSTKIFLAHQTLGLKNQRGLMKWWTARNWFVHSTHELLRIGDVDIKDRANVNLRMFCKAVSWCSFSKEKGTSTSAQLSSTKSTRYQGFLIV